MISSILLTFIGTYIIVYSVLLFDKNSLLVSISTGLLTGIFIYISSFYRKSNLFSIDFPIITFNPIMAMCHYLEGLITFVQLAKLVSIEIIAGLFAFLTKKYIF
jgi:hypothetical protein